MNRIEFEEEQAQSSIYTPQESGFTGWLIRKTPITHASQAHVVMLIIIITCFILAGLVTFNNPSGESVPEDLIIPTDY